ncbi:MAG: aldo/keto reductase, partial [Candidatus Methylarchaceae archaeon HK02M1]|nr:aldo/keto reductase [Candidatus Methylarchaceae archaeon HK02M1]
MEYREFGRAKIKVSTIGMGTYYDILWIATSYILSYQLSKEDKITALKKGIELGINLIDTAEIYETESLIAEAIKDYKRDELFITTKVSPTHLKYEKVLKAAQRSLEKLQCSYIDLYQIHWPNPLVSIKETMRAMENLVDEGKVRYIGVSNFSLSQTKDAEEALSKHELVSNQVEYSLKVRKIEVDMLPYCDSNNIVILAYRPVAHGALANPSGRLKVAMNEISQKHGGKTPAQIALNWLLNKSEVVFPIPRASKLKRVMENAGAVGWRLDSKDLTKLETEA